MKMRRRAAPSRSPSLANIEMEGERLQKEKMVRKQTLKLMRKATTMNSFGGKPWKNAKKKISDALDHPMTQTVLNLVTLFALFGDDIRVSSLEKSADTAFVVMTSISLGLFLLELILASLVKRGYIFSFFFWLDLVSTVSLITDIEPLMLFLFDFEQSENNFNS
jgi:hypothetical protein